MDSLRYQITETNFATKSLRTALNYFLGREIEKEASAERQRAEDSLPHS
jgi:hypothetical protein